MQRCAWVNLNNPLLVAYHDEEWGRPVHDDVKHFEMLTLEGAQAGLSWETILNKRAHYRKLFARFDPLKVSRFSPEKVEKLLTDPGIVRNRLKVESAISNAKAFLKIQKEFGTFDDYIWGFVNHKPIRSPLSDMISKDLKKRGFRFVGSTIIYAYMQAIGMVNSHSPDCDFSNANPSWHVYILRCADNSLYTGITTDVQRRLLDHQDAKKGAKYLRKRGPFQVVFQQLIGNKSQALKIERWIKSLSKGQKETLVKKGVIDVDLTLD